VCLSRGESCGLGRTRVKVPGAEPRLEFGRRRVETRLRTLKSGKNSTSSPWIFRCVMETVGFVSKRSERAPGNWGFPDIHEKA